MWGGNKNSLQQGHGACVLLNRILFASLFPASFPSITRSLWSPREQNAGLGALFLSAVGCTLQGLGEAMVSAAGMLLICTAL